MYLYHVCWSCTHITVCKIPQCPTSYLLPSFIFSYLFSFLFYPQTSVLPMCTWLLSLFIKAPGTQLLPSQLVQLAWGGTSLIHTGTFNCLDLVWVTIAVSFRVQKPCHFQRAAFQSIPLTLWNLHSLSLLFQDVFKDHGCGGHSSVDNHPQLFPLSTLNNNVSVLPLHTVIKSFSGQGWKQQQSI